MFKAVDPKVDIGKLEQEQIEFWRLGRVFQRTTEGRDDAPRYVFYEGPPTANGKPGTHHALARSFKDMFPRYKVMRGYHVERRGGWDTHGLPVEIAVEKELGFTDKRQIEEYGIAEFNKKCRESVFRNIADWERMTERMGYWVDLDNAYVTFTNEYIESIWWVLRQLWDKGLLYRGYKVVAYSPSSGTVLSSHEVAQGYQEITDPSVYVRFPLRDKPGVYFLAWTTTPWTLPGNAALAVNPLVDYVQVEVPLANGEGTEQLILAEARLNAVLHHEKDKAPEYTIINRFKGKDLINERYNPLYTFLPTDKDHAYVLGGSFVTTDDGTGIVHIAPAFGKDDSELGQEHDLPIFITVASNGRFIDAVDNFKGLWFKDADVEIIKDLKTRGLMYRSEKFRHTYPHNWRDGKPLMYMARDTWFINTTKFRDQMIAKNKTINWYPSHVRDGRFGEWLEDLKEWALGRERYWGTPLPIWVDDQNGDMLCVASVAELSQLTGRDLTDLDLHRPYVDDITFPNPNGTGGTMRRVPEVIDVWFDSGAMPVAQSGYPYKNADQFAQQFPADYICEAVDQTRGWFYSLHAIAVMLFDEVAYKNVICLGHILDGEGKKMSKSKGNIIDPWLVMDKYGADAFRWYLYTAAPPGESRRFSLDLVGQVVSKFYNTLWNTYSFFLTYANIDQWTPSQDAPAVADRDLLDRWVLAELHKTIKVVTEAYDTYNVTDATRPVEAFVEVLSNWYIRRSRRRFWKSGDDNDKKSAYATLYECLVTVSKLIAPAMPFLSESLYRNLVVSQDSKVPDSVHLADWPQVNEALIDGSLLEDMALVQQLVSLGLAGRSSFEIGVRQPLGAVSFGVTGASERATVEQYADVIKDELNIKTIKFLSDADGITVYRLSPVFAKLGSKLKGDMQAVKTTLASADNAQASAWGRALLANESISLEVNGKTFTLTPDEIEVRQEAKEGFAVAEERGYVAVLDVTITPELKSEGIAREVVRRIQTLRKEANFDISDRIRIAYQASGIVLEAIEQFAENIRTETLCVEMNNAQPSAEYTVEDFTESLKGELDGETLVVGVKRIS